MSKKECPKCGHEMREYPTTDPPNITSYACDQCGHREKEKPWTNLPFDISMKVLCQKHKVFFEPRKIDDKIGYGLFCPKCEREIIEKRINEIPEWAFEFAKQPYSDCFWIELLYCLAMDTTNPKPITIINRVMEK